MARKTKEDAQATRSLILDTAEVVFGERGVSGASLQQIAQAAGLTRGAIYWHFQDKPALFHAMMDRVRLPLEESPQRARDPALADPLKHLRSMLVRALRRVAGDAQTRRVVGIAMHKVEYVGELTPLRDRHLAVREDCLAQIEGQLRLARQRGQIGRRVPVRTAARGLHALIDGLILNWTLDPQAFDLVKAGVPVLDAYLAGLAA